MLGVAVIKGFVGAPVGTFADHRKRVVDNSVSVVRGLNTDEELLASFLTSKR